MTYYADIQYRLKKNKTNLIELGELLRDVKSNDLWTVEIGEGINTWADFLSMPEVGLTVREANELIGLYHFANDSGIDYTTMPWASFKLLAKRGVEDEELVVCAQTLTTKDLKERMYDVETEDKGERSYSYMVMKRCVETGNLSKVYGVESDEVLEAFKDIKDE